MSDQDIPQEATSVDRLTSTIGETIAEVANRVGDAVGSIAGSMVGSADSVANLAVQQVTAASHIAHARAGFRFKALLEESAIQHLEEISTRRLALEARMEKIPEGSATRKFLERSLATLDEEEMKILKQGEEILSAQAEPLPALPQSPRTAEEPPGKGPIVDMAEEEVADPEMGCHPQTPPPKPPRPGSGTYVGGMGVSD